MPVQETLDRLRAAADAVRAGWVPTSWQPRDGAGRAELSSHSRLLQGQPYVVIPELVVPPGEVLELGTRLQVPAYLHGVPTTGDPLELTINSLYPIGLTVDGRRVFDGDRASSAAGPALIQVVDALGHDPAQELTMRLIAPHNATPQIAAEYIPPWVWLHFTTPGLRARFELLDLVWARLFLADALAEPDERALVGDAVALLPDDPHAITTADADAVMRTLIPMSARLEQHTLHLVGHSHIDLAWLWRWDDTVEVVQRDAQTVLALMDDFPDMFFTHSQPATYEVLRERRPDLFERIRKQIDAGRWEPATAQWVETDANLVSGESMARQLLEGVTYSRDLLGRTPDVVMAPDTFGHAGNLPQLAASAGARAYYHMRCNPGGDADPWPAYWWDGDDGSRVLAISTPEYYGHITAGEAAQSVARAATAGHHVGLQLYGVCDHGGAPTRQSLETLQRLQDEPAFPRLVCSTLSRYVDALLEAEPELPVHRGESSLTFRGCYTSHTDSKQLNRRGEELLTTADTLAVLAGLVEGVPVDAWRTHLRHQFHDILGGSSIADVYVDQAADAAGVEAAATAVLQRALSSLHAGVASGRIAVTNPHAWERVDVVVVDVDAAGPTTLLGSHGHVTPGQQTETGLCFVARVPGFSTVSYELRAGDEHAGVAVEEDGALLRVRAGAQELAVDAASGAVVRWTVDGAEVHDPRGSLAALQLVEEDPAPMSAWVLGRTRTEQLLSAGSTRLVEAGPVRAVLETTHRVRRSTIRQRLHIYADLDRIDAEVELDWQEPGGPELGSPGIKVVCGTRRPDTTASYETPFSAATRPTDGGEVPALRWAAIEDAAGRGVAVLNDSRHAYDAVDGTLRLRLVRSPYEPDPAADIGTQRTRYAVLPLTSGWRSAGVPRAAAGFASSLLAGTGGGTESATPVLRLEVDADSGIVVAGLKPARRGHGFVIRLYESTGAPGTARLHCLPPGVGVHAASVVEDERAQVPVIDGRIEARLQAFEVLTLVVSAATTA